MDRTQLSPRTLGEAIGVSQSSLKRWADRGILRVHRTAGGHRRIDRREALRFIREAGFTVVRPELLGISAADLSFVDRQGGAPRRDSELDDQFGGRGNDSGGSESGAAYLICGQGF